MGVTRMQNEAAAVDFLALDEVTGQITSKQRLFSDGGLEIHPRSCRQSHGL